MMSVVVNWLTVICIRRDRRTPAPPHPFRTSGTMWLGPPSDWFTLDLSFQEVWALPLFEPWKKSGPHKRKLATCEWNTFYGHNLKFWKSKSSPRDTLYSVSTYILKNFMFSCQKMCEKLFSSQETRVFFRHFGVINSVWLPHDTEVTNHDMQGFLTNNNVKKTAVCRAMLPISIVS